MRFTKISFENTQGERLAARLDMPDGSDTRAFALFAHCFTCTKNLRAVGHISEALTRAGIAVLRFDFTGLGESEGDFADTNFSSNIADLIAAAQYLASSYKPPEILIGHSLGGAAVLQAAAHIPSVAAVATIGAPCHPQHVSHLLESKRDEIQKTGLATVAIAGRRFQIKKQFLDDLEETNMVDKIRSLKRALLIFHSPVDQTVGIENAARIFEVAKHPKSFVSLDHADHLLTAAEDSRYAGVVIAAWAEKYVSGPAASAPKKTTRSGETSVRTGETGYRTEILAGGHALISDEPVAVGGTDTGPNPYELVAAGLGACTSMTLRMYADHKKWPLAEVGVELRHEKMHAADCATCETEEGKIDKFERIITLHGSLSEAQRTRLLEIAGRCPVHRTLTGEIIIETRLAPADGS